jgi:hypothetical protein
LSDNACSSGFSFGKAYGYAERISKEQVGKEKEKENNNL